MKRDLPTINGVPPGCGVTCKSCERDVREFCWLMRTCDLQLTDLGGSATARKKR